MNTCEKCKYFLDDECYANPPRVVVLPVWGQGERGYGCVNEACTVRPRITKYDPACGEFEERKEEEEEDHGQE
jgi:hypothetical protein